MRNFGFSNEHAASAAKVSLDFLPIARKPDFHPFLGDELANRNLGKAIKKYKESISGHVPRLIVRCFYISPAFAPDIVAIK